MNRLLAFYHGTHPDDRGRFLEEILRQDDLWLETTHDYVQWLFPLAEESQANPGAPRLDREVISAFHADAVLRQHLLASFVRMLRFYGLELQDGQAVTGANWRDRKSNWFTQDTHNNLRITRILKSLSILGLRQEADALLRCLEALRRSEPDCGVGETAYRYWRERGHGPDIRDGRSR